MPYIGRDLNRGNYLKLDDISSSFNGSTQTFNLTVGGSAFIPGSAFSILVSVGGVIQEPESAYQVNNSEITFANAPTAQDGFFCIALAVPIGIGVPGNGTVNGTQIAKPFNYDGYFYLDDANNRVGIGSLQPTVALDVDGVIKASSFTGGSGGINAGVVTCTGLDVNGNGDISGNLVLGGDLTVNGTTSTIDTNLIGVDRVEVGANSSTIAGIAVTQSGTADLVRLYDGTSQVVTVDDEGKVGLGSAIPSEKLDVVGNIKASGTITGSSFVGALPISSDGNNRVITATGSGGLNGEENFIAHAPSSGVGYVELKHGGSSGDYGYYQIRSGSTLRGRLGSNYNVDAISLDTAGGSSTAMIFKTGSSQTERLRITSDGRIGINDSTPNDYEVDIMKRSTATDAQIRLYNNATGSGNDTVMRYHIAGTSASNYIYFGDGDDSNIGQIRYSHNNDSMQFTTGANERLRITSSGTVGVNCTPTAAPLEVKQLSADGGALRLRDSSAQYRYLEFDVTGSNSTITARSNNSHGNINIGTIDQFGRTTQLYIKGGANAAVGIGTDNPSKTLTLFGASSSSFRISKSGVLAYDHTFDGSSYTIANNNGSAGIPIIIGTKTAGGESLRITSTGKVSIGNESSPLGTLHVKEGDSGVTSADTSQDTLFLESNGNAGLTIATPNANTGYLTFADPQDSNVGQIIYRHSDNSMSMFVNAAERLRITSVGDLSLRTTTQNAYLGLTANSTAINTTLGSTTGTNPRLYLKGVGNGQSDSGDVFIGAGTGGTVQIRSAVDTVFEVNSDSSTLEALRIDSSGRLLMNGASSTQAFSGGDDLIIGNTSSNTRSGITLVSNSAQDGGIYFSDGTSSGNAHVQGQIVYDHGDSIMRFYTNADEKMRIASSGTVEFHGGDTGTEHIKIQSEAGGASLFIANYQGVSDTGDSSSRLGVGKDDNVLLFTNASGSQISNFAIGNTDSVPLVFSTANTKRLVITGSGQLQHQSGSGVSYFNGASEYIFGSASSSPSSGGNEANVQIHSYKTRAHFSINGYMNNAGGSMMQFVSSRSGTPGTLGTKCISNDYLGETRYFGDNGTNGSTLAHGATIWARAKSTPADGDTVIAGEINFSCGDSSGGSLTDKMKIQGADGKIKFGPGLIHQLHSQTFSMYPDNGGNNITRLTFTGLQFGTYIAQIGYYNAAGQGYGGGCFHVSGYQTASYTYNVHEIVRWDNAGNSAISAVSKYNSSWVIDITNTHGSYTGAGEVSVYGDAQVTCTVTYHQ